jgi:predicted kinase
VTDERAAVLAAVAARIDALPRPALVAVDGVSAAGKTMFADELVRLVRGPAVRISVDDFHRPAAERHARGQGPETYYHDTFDVPALRRALEGVDAGTVAVVDGIFLLRPELADVWTFSVFLECDRAVALERAIARDAALFGGRGRSASPVRIALRPRRDALPRGRGSCVARRPRRRAHRPRAAPPRRLSHSRPTGHVLHLIPDVGRADTSFT